MYTVPGNCTPLGWQTTEGSPGWTWQAWGGSFLLLPRRHALSSRWLWTFNHNTCENRQEEVQGSATSPLFTPPLFQNTWPCVQFLCAELNAPCQRDLAIDKAKPPASAAKWQGNDQLDLQCQAARHCHHQVQWSTCAAWHWGSGPHSEGEKTSMVWTWNAPVVQSRQPLTYRLMESVGLGGPKWHGSSWQRGIAESGSSRLSTLMIDVPGDLVWDLPCVQQASYLEGGPLMWMLPLYQHINQKSDYDDIMMLDFYEKSVTKEHDILVKYQKRLKVIDFSSQANIVYYSFYYIPFCQCDSAVILKVSQVSTSNFDITVMFGLCLFCESNHQKKNQWLGKQSVISVLGIYLSHLAMYMQKTCALAYIYLWKQHLTYFPNMPETLLLYVVSPLTV